MTETKPTPAAVGTARRLLRFRYPLFAMLFCNALIVAGVPFAELQKRVVTAVAQSNDSPPSRTPARAADRAADNEPTAAVAESQTGGDAHSPQEGSEIAEDELEGPGPDIKDLDHLMSFLDEDGKQSAGQKTGDGQPGEKATTGQQTPNIVSPPPASATKVVEPPPKPSADLTELAQGALNAMKDVIRQNTGKQPTPPQADSAKSSLLLSNPKHWDTKIHLAIDGEVLTLYPGETLEFEGDVEHIVQFHRGGDFGIAELTYRSGKYNFDVTASGWTLIAGAPDQGM